MRKPKREIQRENLLRENRRYLFEKGYVRVTRMYVKGELAKGEIPIHILPKDVEQVRLRVANGYGVSIEDVQLIVVPINV